MPWLVLAYGTILILVASILRQTDGGSFQTTFLAGSIGGAVCLLLGVLGLLGWRYRVWTILTLAAICYVLLSQVVISWLGGERADAQSPVGPILLTLTLVISVGFVAFLAQPENRAVDASAGALER